MRTKVWAIAKIDATGQTVEIIPSSPREPRARRHVDRLNRQRQYSACRFVLQGDKVKR